MKYNIGDIVWVASFEAREAWVTCPDCLGSKRLRVIMGDDTEVSIDCKGCEQGYLGPLGHLRVYDRTPHAVQSCIREIKLEDDGPKYSGASFYEKPEAEVYDNQEEAAAAAAVHAARMDKEERDRIAHKEKDTKSWAWNASYHRKAIKDAERQLAHHRAKLAVAAAKAKEAPKS